jgi:hypothetical protein
MAARTLGITIERPWEEVYRFLAEPMNYPAWASGLGNSMTPAGDHWIAQGRDGPVCVRFTPPNPLGVADHVVVPPPGGELSIPLRVLPNGSGSLVMLTLFRPPGVNDARFEADADWVNRDLASLKRLLES